MARFSDPGEALQVKPFMFEESAPFAEASPHVIRQVQRAPRGPIQFRFVLKFAPQLSTPCSRGLSIKPRYEALAVKPAPRIFQTYLQRHSVLAP